MAVAASPKTLAFFFRSEAFAGTFQSDWRHFHKFKNKEGGESSRLMKSFGAFHNWGLDAPLKFEARRRGMVANSNLPDGFDGIWNSVWVFWCFGLDEKNSCPTSTELATFTEQDFNFTTDQHLRLVVFVGKPKNHKFVL